MGKILIVCPHPDDEIFVLNNICRDARLSNDIDILYLSGTEERIKEAKKSCCYLKFNFLFLGADHEIKDGRFHESFKTLRDTFREVIETYDLIFCTALEGGHQDHDTTAMAIISSLENNEFSKILFYPCYTSLNRSMLYKVRGRNNYVDCMQKIEQKYTHLRTEELFLSMFIYKSQRLTWIFLWPALFIKYIFNGKDVLYMLMGEYSGLSIINSIKTQPLYEKHARIKFKEWKSAIIHDLEQD